MVSRVDQEKGMTEGASQGVSRNALARNSLQHEQRIV